MQWPDRYFCVYLFSRTAVTYHYLHPHCWQDDHARTGRSSPSLSSHFFFPPGIFDHLSPYRTLPEIALKHGCKTVTSTVMAFGLQGRKSIAGTVNKNRDDVADHSVSHPRSTVPTGNYLFTLTPTFTQGLIFGQIPILFLVYLILFFNSKSIELPKEPPGQSALPFRPSFSAEEFVSTVFPHTKVKEQGEEGDGYFVESAEWLNVLLKQIVDDYRRKLRAIDSGLDEEKEKATLGRIQDLANEARPQTLLGPIHVRSVDLGASAPRISNAKITKMIGGNPQVEVDLNYTDTASISVSTTALLNFPFPGFAKLPVSLVVSLELFSCKLVFTPPKPTTGIVKQLPITSEESPVFTINIPPSSISLHLKMNTTIGLLPQLANIQKLHELIETQVKKLISEQATWTVILPGMSKPRAGTKESDSSDG
ncbi:hypothetical protein BJ322DRAFT_1093309 [Thelephora terrestris]|uniref:SMP-LTD domain-containing protein n=1 Tax=Thelephora terrestris TaxID=56493 RepID=A0A9P6H2N8_9AGAM|nr:hypothetical protein BJ322DRAFT_1093309 [Thelephora terrestris]